MHTQYLTTVWWTVPGNGPALYVPLWSVITSIVGSLELVTMVTRTPARGGSMWPLIKSPSIQWNEGTTSGQSKGRKEGGEREIFEVS